jgi:molecular chaperone Hsp33
LTANGTISIKVLVATELVKEATEKHGCSPVAAAVLGRALMGVALMTAGKDELETVQLQIDGGGPIGLVMAEAVTTKNNNVITCRGFVSHPSIDTNGDGALLNVATAVGGANGVLRVMRRHPLWTQPHFSSTALESGEIAEDIARFMLESEQVPAAVGLGVSVGSGGLNSVTAAAGFLVSALPGCSEEELFLLERNVHQLPPPSDLVRAGADASGIAERLLEGLTAGHERTQKGEHTKEDSSPSDHHNESESALNKTLMFTAERVSLACSCSDFSALRSLQTAVPEGRSSRDHVPVTCEWCGTTRLVSQTPSS